MEAFLAAEFQNIIYNTLLVIMNGGTQSYLGCNRMTWPKFIGRFCMKKIISRMVIYKDGLMIKIIILSITFKCSDRLLLKF